MVMGNSGWNIDSLWATGQAVLLASSGFFNVESFHLRLETRDQGRDALYTDWLLVTLTKERPLRLPTKWERLN